MLVLDGCALELPGDRRNTLHRSDSVAGSLSAISIAKPVTLSALSKD